jgi:hypothetical protein
MIAHLMQSKCKDKTIEQKLEIMKEYTTADLLYLLREIESRPMLFDERIIKECYNLLDNKNIICI